jgi:fructokinase
LGGAPLNFGVHARRLGHPVALISAVGADELGAQALRTIAALDVPTRFLHTTSRFPTGIASVQITEGGETRFRIERPAAYDALDLSNRDIEIIQEQQPKWFYYGTLFASTPLGKHVLDRLFRALPQVIRFYDLNLRCGYDSPELVKQLLDKADVVKLNEEELDRVAKFTGLPSSIQEFCCEGAARYGWKAVAVTRGDRGCAISAHGDYVQAAAPAVEVVDTVGAGDAFAAAFLHGLSHQWPAVQIAPFANRIGALVASRHGAIPDWTLEEVARL